MKKIVFVFVGMVFISFPVAVKAREGEQMQRMQVRDPQVIEEGVAAPVATGMQVQSQDRVETANQGEEINLRVMEQNQEQVRVATPAGQTEQQRVGVVERIRRVLAGEDQENVGVGRRIWGWLSRLWRR